MAMGRTYPDMMDGVMPVVSLPITVSGRNLLWRRMVIDAIRSDPDWKNGDYTQPPARLINGYRVLRMMIDSAPALQQEIPDGAAADKFLATTRIQAGHVDPNDILYSLKSSSATTPSPSFQGSRPSSSHSIFPTTSSTLTSCRFSRDSSLSSSRVGMWFRKEHRHRPAI